MFNFIPNRLALIVLISACSIILISMGLRQTFGLFFKAFEEGSETLSKESNTLLASRQEKFIRDLRYALIRIENKTYGVCRKTGKLISKKRLELVPHATLSIEAKKSQGKK